MTSTYQGHDLPNSPLHMKDFGALDADQTTLAAQLREKNVGTIHLHHLANLVQSVKQDVVNLAGVDHHILDVNFDSHHQLSEFLLRAGNLFGRLARNVNLIFASTVRTGRGISEDSRERWGEIDGGAGGSFDELDVLPSTTTHQGVHGKFQLDGIDVTFELLIG